ncbi:hypothetical protein [Treponema sp.]|uniref:hypothetical protein n=1 Tax=Treponema sp. TaxID=166 RepID=UPI00298E8787|nr:hypothetical protein [Treponema sp.]MCQ2241379.1 hypothetical protein [Treponema sp.]
MAIANIIKNIFSKKEEKSSGPSLVEEINRHMTLLVEKSGNLNENFESEKAEIASIAKEAASIKESKEILAAKLEQDILGRITAVSSACELAIAGKSNDSVKKEISSLKAKMNQRSALK